MYMHMHNIKCSTIITDADGAESARVEFIPDTSKDCRKSFPCSFIGEEGAL